MQKSHPYIDPATGLPQGFGSETNRASEKEYLALSVRIEQARGPIASILERRYRRAQQFRNQYTPDKLVADYVGDRFDLVIDSSDQYSFNKPVLHQSSGEVLDITDGIIKLFKQKSKP